MLYSDRKAIILKCKSKSVCIFRIHTDFNSFERVHFTQLIKYSNRLARSVLLYNKQAVWSGLSVSYKCHAQFSHSKSTQFKGGKKLLNAYSVMGAQWLSGNVLDSRPKGRGFEPHRRHCVVVLEQDTFILA